MTNQTLEKFSEKFARAFISRMVSSNHLYEDLKQEAAIAILLHAPRWREDGGANLETFTRIYAWKAMQELCTRQSGPVGRPTYGGKFEGTRYDIAVKHHRITEVADGDFEKRLAAQMDDETPETIVERAQADVTVREFAERRATRFNGSGKLSRETIANVLVDLMRGDSCQEIGERYGCSRQYVSMVAARAEVA